MRPRLRKLALTAHIASSVGWFGSVLTFLAVAIVGVTTADDHVVRAANLIAEPVVWFVVLPFAVASLLTGLVSSLGSAWGLFRHYWVLAKLLLTVVATAVLLAETRTVAAMAEYAASGADPRAMPGTLPHSIGGLVVLLLITILSVVKPQGLTPYGWRERQEHRRTKPGGRMPVSG